MATVKELMVRIGADMSDFEKKMGRVQGKLKSTGDKIKGAGKTMSKMVTGPVVALTAGLGGLVNKTAQHGDEVAKNARKVGVSTEAYQEYRYALGQTGLSSADTDKALGRLNQRMGLAAAGNEKYSNALEALGFNMDDVRNGTISTDEAMMQAIGSLSEIENEQERAALATELFGTKLSRELMPAIEGGADGLEEGRKKARELGIVMSDETARKTEDFNDKMEDLKTKMLGVGMSIGSKLIPILMDKLIPAFEAHVIPVIEKIGQKIMELIEWFTNLSPKMQKIIVVGTGIATALGPLLVILGSMVGAISNLIPVVTSMVTVFKTVISVVRALGVAMKLLALNPIGLVITAIAGAVAVGIYLYKNWDEIKPKLIAIWNAVKEGLAKAWDAVWGKVKWLKDKVVKGWNNIKNGIKNKANEAREQAINKFNSMKDSVVNKVTSLKDGAVNKFNALKTGAVNKVNALKSGISNKFESAKSAVVNKAQAIKSGVVNKFTSLVSSGAQKFNSLRDKIVNPIQTARDKIKGAIDKIKGFFSGLSSKLKIKIPKPKIPSFSLKGKFSLKPPSVPKIGINWNAKGGIFNRATLLGGGQGVGEAGLEAALPLQGRYMRPFAHAVASQMPTDNGENRREKEEPKQIIVPVNIDGKEVARVTAPHMDRELGRRRKDKTRAGG